MLSDHDFQEKAAEALEDLENRVSPAADEHEFEVEAGGGMLTFLFTEPRAARVIFSPNSPARQIWLSALSTSFKFGWDDAAGSFVLDKTGEPFLRVVSELLKKQIGSEVKLA